MAALDCCICDSPFDDRLPVPLGPTPESGLFGCHPCLGRLVARARRNRYAARTQDAEKARDEAAAWLPVRERHLARLGRVTEAAEAVTTLVREESVEPLRMAWLLVSLESANSWIPDAPEPPSSVESEDRDLKDAAFRLQLAMIGAREVVAERLAYHVINQAQPPEMCEEFECPDGCTGRHDVTDIDCGPDCIFDDLAEHGVMVEPPEPETPFFVEAGARRPSGTADVREGDSIPDMEATAPQVLTRLGVDPDDLDVLLNAAAVGLVVDAWREGPLEAIHGTVDGPSDAEVFAQGVDLYRRARAALVAARDDGPEGLLGFVAVASDVELRWAGGSRFALRTVPEAGPVAEFVRHVDDRVWFTREVMREQGWRAALLHRAVSAATKARGHFGMPGWPGAVVSAMDRLTALDRSGAPDVLTDLEAVRATLLEAPDRLGVGALDWMLNQRVFG
ncbi:hypothetical protein [Actinacidiphila guanduensis]|uniref:hypothetical protein n=1 Tax=Actinacidiphila guanduensis TaxID=310781 RepID=UPI001FE5E379|nr:hypothetical protein [Actinacidiphila guanduensis]